MRFLISNTNLGKNIRYLRRQQNLSAEEFAGIIGITPSELDVIETEEILDLEAEVFRSICKFFNRDMETLVEKNLKSICRGGS